MKYTTGIILVLILAAVNSTYGAWPAEPWWGLPELEYIYNSGDTIWLYSALEDIGFPPRYVVTYEKSTGNIEFYLANSKEIPKDAPIDFPKPRELSSYLSIKPYEISFEGTKVSIKKPSEVTFKGTKIAIPKLTSEEIESLGKWSVYLQRNRHIPLSEITLSNELQGSLVETDGVYYFGMKGGISERIGHIGGLVVYRPSEKKSVILRSKYLVDCSVTGILRIDDELAISTVFKGETGNSSSGLYWEDGKPRKVGLVLYNINTGKWRHLSTENANISGDIIREMEVIDDSIWMITNWGISYYQPKTDKVRSWRWSLSLVEKHE